MTLRYRALQCLALLFVAFALSQLWYLGQVLRLQHQNPEASAYMQRAKAQGQVQQYWRDYDQISDYLKRAVLISEDAQFTNHSGFDWQGIRYALRRNMEAGKPVAGDGYAQEQKSPPVYLPDAVDLFSKSDFIRKSMGAEFQRIFTLTKEQEMAEFRRQISTLEYRSYLEQL